MITITTAENALKTIYLDSVMNDINRKTNPFLTMIEENVRYESGKDAKVNIRCGNSGVGVGTETGDLPTSTNEQQVELSVPLKNLYGTFQISDKALKAASLDPNAFASLLGNEMQNLVAAAQAHITKMLYGNGKKLMAIINPQTDINYAERVISPKRSDLSNFANSMNLTILDNRGNYVTNESLSTKISVNIQQGYFMIANTPLETVADCAFIYNKNDDGTQMNGIDTVFNENPYGLNLTDYPELVPYFKADDSETLRLIDDEAIMEFMDGYEEHCGSMPADIILTHPRVSKAIFETLKDRRANIATTELAGGFTGFSFNGIPVYSDVKCKPGTLYALNSKSFAMHQLCDWSWLSNEDGTILKQTPGKPYYAATLVKYADLICEKPFLQGKLCGFMTTRWK